MRKENCGERIREALSLRNMRAIDLCNITGIPRSAMSQYMSNRFEPKQDRIYLISKALNVSEAWLMGFDVPMSRQEIVYVSSDDNISLSADETTLVINYRELNNDGKGKAQEYISDLKTIEKYTAPDEELKSKLNA